MFQVSLAPSSVPSVHKVFTRPCYRPVYTQDRDPGSWPPLPVTARKLGALSPNLSRVLSLIHSAQPSQLGVMPRCPITDHYSAYIFYPMNSNKIKRICKFASRFCKFSLICKNIRGKNCCKLDLQSIGSSPDLQR